MAVIWLLVGAAVGAAYQALNPLQQRRVTSIARGAAGGIVGGFLYVAFIDRTSPASWLGAYFIATMAVSAVGAARAALRRFDAYKKSQDVPVKR